MSLIVSYCFCLSLTVPLVPWSFYMFLTVSSSTMKLLHVSHCLPLSLAISPIAMEFLFVSNCLQLLLAVSHCLPCLMELLHVCHFLLSLLAVSHCLS